MDVSKMVASGLLWSVVACTATPGGDSGGEDGSETSALATDESSEASTSPESTTAESSSSDASSTGIDPSSESSSADSDSETQTTGAIGNCPSFDLELLGTLELTTFRAGGEDIVTPFDPEMGSIACLDFENERAMLELTFGPPSFDGPLSRIRLEVDVAPRSYDLATDTGHDAGQVWLGYVINDAPASESQYDPQSSPLAGTVDVVATAFDDVTFDVSAAGEIGGPDGWVFDFRFVGAWQDG